MGTITVLSICISCAYKVPNRHKLMIKQTGRIHDNDCFRARTCHAPTVITRATAYIQYPSTF